MKSNTNATPKSSLLDLVAIFLLLIGTLIVISDILIQVVDLRALAIGFEMQLLGLGLIIIGKNR